MEYILYSSHNAMGLICIISSFNLHYQASKIMTPILQMRPSLGLREGKLLVQGHIAIQIHVCSGKDSIQSRSDPDLIPSTAKHEKVLSLWPTHSMVKTELLFLSPSQGLSHPTHIRSHFTKMMKFDKPRHSTPFMNASRGQYAIPTSIYHK